MSNFKNIEVYVLAGGKSSRMGQDKGTMLFQNKPMILHVLEEVKKLNLPIKIVANNNLYKVFGYKVLKDIISEKGPMGGILTAMHHSKNNSILVLSCDTPFISSEVISYLISVAGNEDITIAKTKTQLHPLCAIYKLSLKKEIEKRIANRELKMQELIACSHNKVVNMDKFEEKKTNTFININTLIDLHKFE